MEKAPCTPRFKKKACCPKIDGAQVRAAPVVGFFLDHANYANHSATSYTAEMAYAYKMQARRGPAPPQGYVG